MTRIRTVIVDDEPLARQGLRLRLGRESDVDIVGEAEDGPSAVQAIVDLRPDLVFLDVQMPGFDGFEVLSRSGGAHLPTVVFVTAFDRYAVKAFDAYALDYLLKPIAHRRFQESLRRARLEIGRGSESAGADRIRALLDEKDSHASRTDATDEHVSRYALRLTVRDGDRFVLVRVEDIDWVEAAANYVQLHAGGRTYQLRITLADLDSQFDPRHFARIHRSTIVNLNRVAAIEPDFHGDYQVALKSGVRLRVSRTYRERLLS
jgi:two-component system, LytTR family, response regulator